MIAGTVNPGANGIPLKVATFDASRWTVHFEADGKDRGGQCGALRHRRQSRKHRRLRPLHHRHVDTGCGEGRLQNHPDVRSVAMAVTRRTLSHHRRACRRRRLRAARARRRPRRHRYRPFRRRATASRGEPRPVSRPRHRRARQPVSPLHRRQHVDQAAAHRHDVGRGSGVERRGPLSRVERHPEQRPDAVDRGRRPRHRVPQSVRLQQRQHVRLRRPAALLRARRPARRALRAQRHRDRDRRQVRRQAAELAQRRRRASGRQHLVHRSDVRHPG